jgi:ferredoxin
MRRVQEGQEPGSATNKELTMSHKISDKCTKCGSCASVCPSEAISEGDAQYKIDPDKCVDCGLCVDECPVEAIAPDA